MIGAVAAVDPGTMVASCHAAVITKVWYELIA
jgi:hypothetical protein